MYGFDVPVLALDEEFDLALIGTKGKWYNHKVSVSNPVKKRNKISDEHKNSYLSYIVQSTYMDGKSFFIVMRSEEAAGGRFCRCQSMQEKLPVASSLYVVKMHKKNNNCWTFM